MGNDGRRRDEPFFYLAFYARSLGAILAGLVLLAGCRQHSGIRVVIPHPTSVLNLAANEVAARLEPSGYKVEVSAGPEASAGQTHAIILQVDPTRSGLQAEGFEIEPIHAAGFLLLRVTAYDPCGAFWGALDVADQIVSAERFDAVRAVQRNRFLAVRATRLPLPLPDALVPAEKKREARDLWRQYFELLSRSRLNSIFFQAQQPLTHFVNWPDATANSVSEADEVKAHAEWVRDLFQLAKDRCLDAYLTLNKSAMEPLLGEEEGSTPATQSQPANPAHGKITVQEVFTALFRTYPELAGVMLEEDVAEFSSPPEDYGRWLAQNLLVPLAQAGAQRPVFLSLAEKSPIPLKTSIVIDPAIPMRFVAPLSRRAEMPSDPDFPVLWQVGGSAPELLPWADPRRVRSALVRMSASNSLGYLGDFHRTDPSPQGASNSSSRYQPPHTERDWFQLLLWGRMGYSLNIPEDDWKEQFASQFDRRGGPSVYAAAAHASQVLEWLQASELDWKSTPQAVAVPGDFRPAPGGGSSSEIRPFPLVSDRLFQQFVAEVLRQKGLLLDPGGESPLSLADSLEREVNQTLRATEEAARARVWRGAENGNFQRRIQNIAARGLAHAQVLRATEAQVRFFLSGAPVDRQQAIRHLDQALQALATAGDESVDSADLLSAWIQEAIHSNSQWQPWRWEKTDWLVGFLDPWQPASPNAVPTPSNWKRVQTSWLGEFGLHGRQPWATSTNQRLRSAFLPTEAEQLPNEGNLLVGRTVVAAKREAKLVLRVVSDQPGSVWVNGRRATALSAELFPWVASSPPPQPFEDQLFYAAVQPGDQEVTVAAPARSAWPRVSVRSLLAPQSGDSVRILAQEAAQLDGGVVFVPGTEAFPQPHIALGEEASDEPAASRQGQSPPWALYSFPISDPGFYRLRIWCYWEDAASAGLNFSLDGVPLQEGIGREDEVRRRWHWLFFERVFDLGPGQHRLAIRGWKPGALLGILEVSPAW